MFIFFSILNWVAYTFVITGILSLSIEESCEDEQKLFLFLFGISAVTGALLTVGVAVFFPKVITVVGIITALLIITL